MQVYWVTLGQLYSVNLTYFPRVVGRIKCRRTMYATIREK